MTFFKDFYGSCACGENEVPLRYPGAINYCGSNCKWQANRNKQTIGRKTLPETDSKNPVCIQNREKKKDDKIMEGLRKIREAGNLPSNEVYFNRERLGIKGVRNQRIEYHAHVS